MEPQEVLGRKCRDRINQYDGICIGFQDWMFGCRHYMVKALKPVEDQYKGVHIVPAPVLEVMSSEVISGLTTTFEYEKEEEAFGRYYRDCVTGFEGTCIGITFTCYDEIKYNLQPKCSKKSKKRDEIPEMWSFDKGRLLLVESVEGIDRKGCDSGHKGGVDYMIPIY